MAGGVQKLLQLTPIFHILVVCTGTLTSFLVALKNGDVNYYLPFISETGAFSPESCIFSLGLILGSFIGSVMISFRFLVITASHTENDTVFNVLNYSALITGLLSMLGLAGVAAFPMSTVFWAHLLVAAIYFIGLALYFIISTIITYKMYGQCRLFLLRYVMSVLISVFLVLLVIIFPIGLKRWHEKHDFLPALKKPEDEGFGLIFTSSLLEWSVVVVILVYILSLFSELKNYILFLKAEKIEDKLSVEDRPASSARDLPPAGMENIPN